MQATFDKFMGLRQDIGYPDLNMKYCHVIKNLDVDDPVGALSLRGGYSKLNANVVSAAFTDIESVYEYRFDTAGETVMIVNDNGTFKISKDGAAFSSLTLPGDSALTEDFKNQYFGYKDHVLITTGNGSTNYVLWYGYVDRENDDNDGLFGNNEEKTDYIFTKAQLICPNGMFHNVNDVAYLGGYYYFAFKNSKFIEKRDSDFHLVDRFNAASAYEEAAVANYDVVICTDGTYLYVAYNWDADNQVVEKINPNGYKSEATFATNITGGTVAGIDTDGTMVYYAIDHAANGAIYELNVSDLTQNATNADNDVLDITCDDTAATGDIYILKTGAIYQRDKGDLATDDATNSTHASLIRCQWDTDRVYVSSQTGDGHIYEYQEGAVNNLLQDRENIDEPQAFVLVGGTTIRAISTKYGTLEEIADTDTLYPGLIAMCNPTNAGSGNLAAGTYFYKVSLVDTDGQEHTLSDPIIVIHTSGSQKATIRISAVLYDVNGSDDNTDLLDYFYRIKYVNLYRAYNSTQDSETPETDYKFLYRIDINSKNWVDDKAAQKLYYFDHVDNEAEDTISSTTFLESSGIGDLTKPRFINAKYFAWVDDQLHYANYYSDDETLKNGLLKTAPEAPDAASNYDPYSYDPGDGDVIKGVCEFFGRSVIFKNRKFGVFYDGSHERTFFPGISGDGGFLVKDNMVYYISDQGLHVFDGNKIADLKPPVKTYFDAASSLTNVSVFYFDNKSRIIFSIQGSRSFVYNANYRIWTYYDSNFAFKGYLKNYSNEYIAWDQQFIYKLFDGSTADAEDVGGGNGTAITVDYESPIFLGNGKGNISFLDTHRHRLYKGSDTLTFTVYDYKTTGKTSVATKALSAPDSGSDAHVRTYYFDKVLGEGFTFRINGSIDDAFKYYGLTIDYREGGLLYR